jgi:hypothetical protein
MSWSARFASASAILALLWAACGGKVVVDTGQASTAGAGGGSAGSSGAGGSGGAGESTGSAGGSGGAGGCDLCHMPSTCTTNQDCCGALCTGGKCFFSPPAGLYCCTDAQCKPGTTCDTKLEACVGCTSDAQCFGVNPTCDVDAGLCH